MADEILRLQQALAEAQRQVLQAERLQKVEQQRREKEQRLREEAQRLQKEERQRRETAERVQNEERQRREEEQRRREDAERLSDPQTLISYLETCHDLSLAIRVITDRSLTTQGDTTNPVGRVFPRRIIPWVDFPARQEEIWYQLSEPSFTSSRQFPSRTQLEYVRSLLNPISSEQGLRYYERDTVENAVQKLIDAVNSNTVVRERLGLRGTVTFESHTNLGNTNDNLSESLDDMLLSQGTAADAPSAPGVPALKAPRKTKAKGKGNRADHFCIYAMSDGANIPKTAIEYKPPHKLLQDEIITGLATEIQPERDVINKHGDSFEFTSRALTAAVVTQLFSYMIGKGIQYGYISTGQVFIFLHIPDDPTAVHYYVCVPNLDVLDDDQSRLHHTAVAQVFAFVLQSLRVDPPPQTWHDAAATLDTWAVEYDDVLSRIPETIRREPQASPYKPRRWREFTRSPIHTRSRCQPLDNKFSYTDESDDEAGPSSPTPDSPTPSGGKAGAVVTTRGTSNVRATGNTRGSGQPGGGRTRIQDRPYCSRRCLYALAHGGPIDRICPNADHHGPRHIALAEFLDLLRKQLAKDRGPDADATPLYLSGSVGALIKVRLSAYGYTLVAKAVEETDLPRLQHESELYKHARRIQGRVVPVCLGIIGLDLPYYYDGGAHRHMLLLSGGGKPLSRCIGDISEASLVSQVTRAYQSLHELRILHCDADVQNLLYGDGVMIVDFEQAEIHTREPLGSLSPNARRKRKRQDKHAAPEIFARELQAVIRKVLRSRKAAMTTFGE